MNYHLINRVDDALIYVSNTPKQLKNIASASPEDWGRTIEKIVRVTLATVVFITVVTLDIATLMYQAGHAFGQMVHGLNDKLTNAIVRKSTQTQPTIDSWQLQLPFPVLQKLGLGSSGTTTTVNTQENQLLLPCTKPGLVMEDQRKEAIITSAASLSKQYASSTRSRRSARRSSSSKKHSKNLDQKEIISDGQILE